MIVYLEKADSKEFSQLTIICIISNSSNNKDQWMLSYVQGNYILLIIP